MEVLGGNRGKALLGRLQHRELTPGDREQQAFAYAIADLRMENLTYRMIAQRLGRPLRQVEQFARSGIYRIYVDHRKAALTEPDAMEDAAAGHAQELRALVPTALQTLKDALSGEKADVRQALQVLKAVGLLDQESAFAKPAVVVCPAGMAHAAHAIVAEDQRRGA